MAKNNEKSLYIITLLIIILSTITSAVGLLYKTSGKAFNFVNQYGNTVKMYEMVCTQEIHYLKQQQHVERILQFFAWQYQC